VGQYRDFKFGVLVGCR